MEVLIHTLREFALTFVPLFVAMDALGILPVVISFSQDMKTEERRRMLHYTIITALGVGVAFMAIGKGVFLLLGIRTADFLIAGGLILLLFAAKDLITGKMIESQVALGAATAGVVPLGTPLTVGPAVLTTLLLLIDQYSVIMVIFSFVLNLAIAWFLFHFANRIVAFLGSNGLKGISKVTSLLLAAIGIKMIRQGIFEILS